MGDESDTGDDATRFAGSGGDDETRFSGAQAPRPGPRDAPPDATIAPGSLLGHTYRIEAMLARGGMGEIYRARHAELDTEHAIKIILPELANSQRIVDLFRREAAILRTIRHDAVVAYDGVFRDENGRVYLVMEFVDGPSLSKLMRQRPLAAGEVRQLRDRLADGLAVAHDKGVIHRDISPDNVILPGGELGQAKIIDFGISKLADPEGKTIIGGDFAGKFAYVSPEQLGMFGGQVDGRSDIYSLGLVLAAAAQGEPLDMGQSPITVIEARRSVPDLSRVPEAVRADLAAMLQPDPADRPASMRDLVRGGRDARAVAGRGSAPEPRTGARGPRAGRRFGAASAVAALVVVIAAGGLGYWYLSRGGIAEGDAAATASGPATGSAAPQASVTESTAETAVSAAPDGATDETITAPAVSPTPPPAVAAVEPAPDAGTSATAPVAAGSGDAGEAPVPPLTAAALDDEASAAAPQQPEEPEPAPQAAADAIDIAQPDLPTAADAAAAAADPAVALVEESAPPAAPETPVANLDAVDPSSAVAPSAETASTADVIPSTMEATPPPASASDAAASAAPEAATGTQTALLPLAPDIETLRGEAQRAVESLSCAGVGTEISETGDIAASGYVATEADRIKAGTLLAALPNVGRVDNGIAVMSWPLCEALDVLRARTTFSLGQPGTPLIEPGGDDGVYREGEHLLIGVTAPASRDGYLYVDYLDAAEGYVVHLLPNDMRTDNRVRAGERIVIGALPQEAEKYTVSPPFGSNLLIAVISADPLFRDVRPHVEQADRYLAALRDGLESAAGGQGAVVASYSGIVFQPR
jgi:hypothetical protein